MRLVIFSDTHCAHEELNMPEGDLLIFAGDMCGYGHKKEAKRFIKWMSDLPHKYKVCICGNHDWPFYKYLGFAKDSFESTGIHYLQDSSVEIDGLKIYGSPWQPEFCNWAFNLPRGKQLAEKWAMIPDDTDILITHGPPATIRDCCPTSVGCDDLLKRVYEIKPKLHVFGHIHTQWGISFRDGITFINASIVDDYNTKVNNSIEWEL